VNEFLLSRALYRGAIVLVALILLVLLGLQVKWVLVQLFAAAIVAAGMAPVVRSLTVSERAKSWPWRPPAGLVVIGLYLVIGLLLLVLGTILVQVLLEQGYALIQRMPRYALTLQSWYEAAIQRSTLLAELDPWALVGGANGVTQWAINILGTALNAATVLLALAGGAINVVFVLFVALYLTLDGGTIREYLLVFLPRDRQAQSRTVITHIANRLGQWVIGELVLCLIVGIGSGIAFSIIGVPGAALLGLVWAFAELVPGIGPFIAAVPSIVLGFVAGPQTGIIATIFTVVWSQIENNVIVPRVMGHAVKLNPLVVLVAILFGYELLGLAGALFAVPVAAALAVIVDELHHERVQHLAADVEPRQTNESSAAVALIAPGPS
jgi:predicted PurR-regulated permease PerM